MRGVVHDVPGHIGRSCGMASPRAHRIPHELDVQVSNQLIAAIVSTGNAVRRTNGLCDCAGCAHWHYCMAWWLPRTDSIPPASLSAGTIPSSWPCLSSAGCGGTRGATPKPLRLPNKRGRGCAVPDDTVLAHTIPVAATTNSVLWCVPFALCLCQLHEPHTHTASQPQ